VPRVHRPSAHPRAPRLGLFVVSVSVLLAEAALVAAGAATLLLHDGHRHTRVFAVLVATGVSGLLVHGLMLRALVAAMRARRTASTGGAGVLAADLAVAVAAVRPPLLLLAAFLVGDQALAILAFATLSLLDVMISGLARGAVRTAHAEAAPPPR